MQNDQDIPIDIHSNKLLDWLISRRHCNREWSTEVLTVREKINNAIQDMPVHEELARLLSGTYINYFHCVRIVDLLKETESETKNIFGRYSSQRMKDWQEIVSLYQRDNIYLAEAAQMLIRNVNCEVPALRRHVTKLQQIQQECDRKSNDCVRNGNELKEKYRSSCRQLGIKGENIPGELVELMKDLPSVYETITAKCKELVDVKSYYCGFTEYTLGRQVENNKSILPVLSYLLDKGNTTVYEWRVGKKPVSIEEPKLEIANLTVDTETDNSNIDFGDGDAIDFGDGAAIDYGDNLEATTNDNEINFDISVEGETGIAKGNDALTILDDFKTRNEFINELYELEAFLDQRIHEMQVDSDLLSMSQFQSAPTALQLQTTESVKGMLTSLTNILKCFGDVKIQKLFLIRASPRYVHRLTESLNHFLSVGDKMLQQREIQIAKMKAASEEEQSLLPKIELIVQRTKELQKDIENDISKRYKNRPVNLMGGVNIL